jgi:hypothetical protein
MPVLESDSESDSWLFSLEYSQALSLNPFSLGLWFCSEYFVVPTTPGASESESARPIQKFIEGALEINGGYQPEWARILPGSSSLLPACWRYATGGCAVFSMDTAVPFGAIFELKSGQLLVSERRGVSIMMGPQEPQFHHVQGNKRDRHQTLRVP